MWWIAYPRTKILTNPRIYYLQNRPQSNVFHLFIRHLLPVWLFKFCFYYRENSILFSCYAEFLPAISIALIFLFESRGNSAQLVHLKNTRCLILAIVPLFFLSCMSIVKLLIVFNFPCEYLFLYKLEKMYRWHSFAYKKYIYIHIYFSFYLLKAFFKVSPSGMYRPISPWISQVFSCSEHCTNIV